MWLVAGSGPACNISWGDWLTVADALVLFPFRNNGMRHKPSLGQYHPWSTALRVTLIFVFAVSYALKPSPANIDVYPSFASWLMLYKLFFIPGTVCPSIASVRNGRGSSTPSPPLAVCPNAIENILFDFLPVLAHGGPCHSNPPHSDVCISSSFGFTQVADAPESTTAVGIVRAIVASLICLPVSLLKYPHPLICCS